MCIFSLVDVLQRKENNIKETKSWFFCLGKKNFVYSGSKAKDIANEYLFLCAFSRKASKRQDVVSTAATLI